MSYFVIVTYERPLSLQVLCKYLSKSYALKLIYYDGSYCLYSKVKRNSEHSTKKQGEMVDLFYNTRNCIDCLYADTIRKTITIAVGNISFMAQKYLTMIFIKKNQILNFCKKSIL